MTEFLAKETTIETTEHVSAKAVSWISENRAYQVELVVTLGGTAPSRYLGASECHWSYRSQESDWTACTVAEADALASIEMLEAAKAALAKLLSLIEIPASEISAEFQTFKV